MKKSKRGQASIIIVVLLIVLLMILMVAGIVILLVNPSILNIGSVQENREPIIIRTIQETPRYVCNYPYIQLGNTCCLDNNNNRICDSDEIQVQNTRQTYCSYPYIREGTSCCLDDNDNRICDIDEYDSHTSNHNYYSSSYLNSPFDLDNLDIKSDEIWMRITNIGEYDYIITSIDIEGCDIIHPDKIIYEDDNKDFTILCYKDLSDRDVTIEYKKSNSDTIKSSSGRIRDD